MDQNNKLQKRPEREQPWDQIAVYIDLTERSVQYRKLSRELVENYAGSRGIAAKLLYDATGPDTDPFGPENLLIFSAGPFTGTPWPTGARMTVTAKSPATNAYGYSNTGGFFGAKLRAAGYDLLVISGKASSPVYLYIRPDGIKILDAGPLWGRDTAEADEYLQKLYPRCRTTAIGPAGENRVRFAAIINDGGRAAGRCGMGAVMGSKMLKALAVDVKGKTSVSRAFRDIAVQKSRQVTEHPVSREYKKWGTSILMNFKNPRGDNPARNHQESQAPVLSKVNAEAVNRYVYKTSGCYACPIQCARHSRVEEGPYSCETHGPEYESVVSFGPLVGNDDMESIIYANGLCNRLGLDTISTGVVISFAMECVQRGVIGKETVSARWGSRDDIIELVHAIANRKGFGDVLAEGVRRAAAVIGPKAEPYALHVKGVETPDQDPRCNRSLGLGHVTSNRGADHLYGLCTIDQTKNVRIAEKYFPEADQEEILDVFSQYYKPEMLQLTEHFSAVSDALGVCKFSTIEGFALEPSDIAEGLQVMMEDSSYTTEKLMQTAERIVNLERMYNIRCGMDRKDDQHPERFTREPAVIYEEKDGALTDRVVRDGLLVDLDPMLDRYYELRGWDSRGIPREKKLRELGL